MYSHELDFYIRERNSNLSLDEFNFVTNPQEHSQIRTVQYDPYNNNVSIWTSDGWYWCFSTTKIIK